MNSTILFHKPILSCINTSYGCNIDVLSRFVQQTQLTNCLRYKGSDTACAGSRVSTAVYQPGFRVSRAAAGKPTTSGDRVKVELKPPCLNINAVKMKLDKRKK